jgi:hypothetical protein
MTCQLGVLGGSVVALACATVLATALNANAQEDPYISLLRVQSGFDTLPGKAGPLKKGLVFVVSDYPQLAGFSVVRDDFDAEMKNLGMMRRLELTRNSEVLDVTIAVAHTSTDNAHELLLLAELALSQASFIATMKRGDQEGVAIGDFNFVAKGTTTSDLEGYIAFVRNNVLCVIRDGRPDSPSTLDVKGLAADIDTRITFLPELTPAGFDALRPIVTAFSPADSTLVAEEMSSTTLTIAVSDPSGEAVKKQVSAEGKLQIDTTVDPIRISPTDAIGVIAIELIAINESLQFSTAQTVVTVTVP